MTKKKRGMQRIKTVRYPRRNVGGDRAFTKLYYVRGVTLAAPISYTYLTQNLAYNVGNAPSGSNLESVSIAGVLGSTPGLSVLAQLYTQYRIRGIKLRFTVYPSTAYSVPAIFYVNAVTSSRPAESSFNTPNPDFPAISVDSTTEQRWCRYRVIANAQTGAKPTTLSAYYSVNRVFGPDAVVKNDLTFCGDLSSVAPYWSASGFPTSGPWLQFGVTGMAAGQTFLPEVSFVVKIEATVYTQFWGKRSMIQ